jgi:hypothetical protein
LLMENVLRFQYQKMIRTLTTEIVWTLLGQQQLHHLIVLMVRCCYFNCRYTG